MKDSNNKTNMWIIHIFRVLNTKFGINSIVIIDFLAKIQI